MKEDKKWERCKNQRLATIVADLAATSTVIRMEDMEHVEVLKECSQKIYRNANGTISKAGNKAKLPFNMRDPATDADIVPGALVLFCKKGKVCRKL
jgi:hypothetical protein